MRYSSIPYPKRLQRYGMRIQPCESPLVSPSSFSWGEGEGGHVWQSLSRSLLRPTSRPREGGPGLNSELVTRASEHASTCLQGYCILRTILIIFQNFAWCSFCIKFIFYFIVIHQIWYLLKTNSISCFAFAFDWSEGKNISRLGYLGPLGSSIFICCSTIHDSTCASVTSTVITNISIHNKVCKVNKRI